MRSTTPDEIDLRKVHQALAKTMQDVSTYLRAIENNVTRPPVHREGAATKCMGSIATDSSASTWRSSRLSGP